MLMRLLSALRLHRHLRQKYFFLGKPFIPVLITSCKPFQKGLPQSGLTFSKAEVLRTARRQDLPLFSHTLQAALGLCLMSALLVPWSQKKERMKCVWDRESQLVYSLKGSGPEINPHTTHGQLIQDKEQARIYSREKAVCSIVVLGKLDSYM